MIWFTSDLHLGHNAVINMQHRPYKDAAEMNNALIHNINECVKKNDKLYILGDVSHHITPEETNELVSRINGRKYLLLGNHDVVGEPEICPYDASLFEFVGNYLKINDYGMNIIMMHYPMLTWPKVTAGSVMLHGHIHSDKSYNEANKRYGIRRYDVGVDANDYYPVSIETIKAFRDETPVSITSSKNLYIPGFWQPDPVRLLDFSSEHPDRILHVHMGSEASVEILNWQENDDILQRTVADAHSLGSSERNMTIIRK